MKTKISTIGPFPSSDSCPRCGCQDTAIVNEVQPDGSTRLRESCCDCGMIFRYVPPSTDAADEPPVRST